MRLRNFLFPICFLLGLLFLLASCKKNDPPQAPECDTCLFEIKDGTGTMIKMACFNRFAIQTFYPQTDSVIYGIPDQLDARFKEAGKTVHFSGTFRKNSLQPTFPDPAFSPERIYQMEVSDIR